MDRNDLLLAGALYLPLAVAAALWIRLAPSPRARAGILFATLWSVVALLAVHTIAVQLDWWRFDASGPGLFGFPLEMHVGWAILWGAVPALLLPRARIAAVAVLLLGVDVALMPALTPTLVLGPSWLLGEALAVAICLVPAQLLFRWTRDDTHLPWRAAMLCVVFTALMLGVLPTVIIDHTGGSWRAIAARPAWITSIALQLLIFPAALGLSAVQELAMRGGGTPVPFDATKRLVTSGPYAYVSNPMQTANSLALLGVGALVQSWWLAAAALMSVIYSAGLAAWDEQNDLGRRYGEPWRAYRAHVRAWIPRWRPYAPPGRVATLYASASCGKCTEIALWFAARKPVALAIVAAEHHPSRDLDRITYDPGDGTPEEQGVAAIARALEHINFSWALLAMIARLPAVSFALQAIVDASGGGPQRVVRCSVSTLATTLSQQGRL